MWLGLEDCRIYTSFYSSLLWGDLVLRLEDCRIYTSFYSTSPMRRSRIDWNTAVLLLPSTKRTIHTTSKRLEYCRIITSFYFCAVPPVREKIGRLPYLYFLLLKQGLNLVLSDWKTAVLLLPSTPLTGITTEDRLEDCRIYTSFYLSKGENVTWEIGRLPYLYFLLLFTMDMASD